MTNKIFFNKIYDQLINNARNMNRNKKDGYFENHHILPRCMGGTDQKHNLVLLTAREHYIAHQLLVRIVDDHNVYRMVAALRRFKKQAKNSKAYELFRTTISKYRKGKYNTSYGKIWIHHIDSKEIKYTTKDEWDNLDEKWIKGLPAQRGGYTSDYIWLNKDGKRIAIPESQKETYLNDGWVRGRNLDFGIDHYKKMSSKRHSLEKDKEHSRKLTGRISVRLPDTNIVKRIPPDQIEKYLNQGYVLTKGSGLKLNKKT